MSPARKRGRPELPKKKLRTGMQVYFTAEVHKAITEAAKREGCRFRTHWIENLVERALAQ